MPKTTADKAAAKPKPRQKKNAYKFPEKLPAGEILKDIGKKEWKLGSSIGKGGFGEIYCASAVGDSSNSDAYVIKIEPHENGPLFVEKNFYIKIAKPDDVEAWRKDKGMKMLGVPKYYGSGSHEYKKEKYRFLVIDRFGQDLWKLFLKNNKVFPQSAVYKCAIQIIDILHYIHDNGYVHGDIKGANLLMGLRKGAENQVYLVDFGLACKYNTKEFQKDPKKAHNGTIEYTSRDMHIGVPTRRGDMEILGFNLLHWFISVLPWEKDLTKPDKVHEKKMMLMENVKEYMKKHYPKVPKVLTTYLDYVSKLKHDEVPDYEYCKEMFIKELKNLHVGLNGKLDFSSKDIENKAQNSPKKTPNAKRKSVVLIEDPVSDSNDDDDDIDDESSPEVVAKKRTKLPLKEKNSSKPAPKEKKKGEQKASWRDAPTAQASKVVKAGEYTKQEKIVTRPRSTKR